MKGIMRKLIYCATAAMTMSVGLVHAVPVHINSGNPAFPFPQFMEYAYGATHKLGNLGTKNPEGVCHAEMEIDTREAYQIHANEFKYTGEEWAGIKYIETPDKSAYDCTEGDGYGLLAAAYMADQITFNGYWMCTHDKRRNRSKKYTDCSNIAADYGYGPFAISDDAGGGGNTAADGDVDVALALYVAYKQWGEFMKDEDGNIVKDACGNPISYKQEMIDVIRGLVALSTRFPSETDRDLRVNSGLIGLDGYPKGGDTWNEQTPWATENPQTISGKYEIFALPGTSKVDVDGVKMIPEFPGANDKQQHIDYDAPAYFREFWELFEELGGDPWEIEQFKRGEASSDWMIGDLISKGPKAIPTAGWSEVSSDGSVTKYTNFNQGEDYRCSWRTISNYMWHGAPKYTWNPKTHKAESGSNTYEYDAAVRMSEFLNNPVGWADGECMEYGDPKGLPYSGPATTEWQYDPMTGATTDPAHFMVINWQNGTGTFSAVSAQDYDLLGTLYRQCVIEWDLGSGSVAGDCYLGTVPHYMHGWARHLGMMVATGNYHAPSQMNPSANMKIYRMIEDSVTYCYTGDKIKFILDYRNYGSVDAKNVVIVENVPEDFVFVEASKGGVYDKASHTITWNIGTVDGVKSDNASGPELNLKSGPLAKTVGQVWYSLKAGDKAGGRYCTSAEITCSNGTGWTTNEYPNVVTSTMQRNCVDVVPRSLIIEKKSDREKVNPDNMATFTINFENSSEAGWIDGGRPRVNVSFASEVETGGSRLLLKTRLFNDAIEPYINYGNYRISYYVYDSGIDSYSENGGLGWVLNPTIYEGGKTIGSSEGVVVSHENIVEGKDDHGRWNQRLCVQFAPLFVTTTMHVSRFFGGANCRIHKGGGSPMRGIFALFPSNYSQPNWEDDWSWGAKYKDVSDGLFYPVTPSWQKLDEKGKSIETPVTKWLTCGCKESDLTVPNILVEEYDGYVWRRILGTGPMAGRDVDNVEVRDTLPLGMTFSEFLTECPLEEFGATLKTEKAENGQTIIVWHIDKMQVKQKGTIKYTAVCNFPSGAECETDDEDIINYAWISGDKNSPVNDTAMVTVTCAKVPDPVIPTTLVKTVDKKSVEIGDEVTYTIEYEQTHGAIFDDAVANASDWALSGASISGGTLSISSGTSAKYNNSLSKNIYVEMDAKIATDQESEIYFRDNIRFVFKYNSSNGMNVTCYDGTKVVADEIVALKNNPSRWTFKLTDDIMQVWIGKDTMSSPAFTAEGLSQKEGYFGFKGVGWNNFDYSNIHVHTDYAYDLTIVDNKPEEITFGSADEGGKLVGDSIVWVLEQGMKNPIPYGKKYTVTWTGTVDACDEFILNHAYAKLFGHSDSEIQDTAMSKCIDESCEGVEKAELTIRDAEICAGDSTVLKAVGTPKSGKYEYEFFLGTTSLGKASSADTFIVKEMGDYKVKISDPSCPSANPAASKSVSLTVNALPDAEITDKAEICKNEALKLGDVEVEDHTIEWYGDKNKAIVVDAEDIPAEDVRNTYYYVLTNEATGCKGELQEWNVVTNEVPSTPEVKPEKELPLKDGVKENITSMASASESGNYVVWYKSDDAAIKDSVKAPILVDLSNEGKVTYYVREKSPEGCIGDIVPVSVVITSSQKPNPNDTTICIGEEIDVTALVKAEEGNTIIWYDENGDEADAPAPYTSDEAGVKEFTVAQTNGTAVSEKSTLTVTTVEVAELKEDEINYCAGDEAISLKATIDDSKCANCKTPTSYNWYIKGQSTSELIPETKVTSTKLYAYEVEPVYEIAKGHTCVGKKASVTVNVEFVPAVMPDHAIHYTLSDAVDGKFPTLTEQDSKAVEASSGNTLVWYDADGKLIGEEAPSPEMVTDDATLTYKVKQVSKNGCESELQEVTVIITKTPIPTTTIAYYCEGEDPDAIDKFAKVTDENYSLIWYDGDPKKGGTTLASAPTINTAVEDGETETIRKYYVAQGNATETSSANVVEVHIFANPSLVTRDSASCEEPVDINGLWSDISKKVEFTTFYTAFGSTLGQDELVTKSGTYRVVGGFNIGVAPNIKECQSSKAPIVIEIHTLGSVAIEGPDAVCPNSSVELSVAIEDEEVFDSTLTYVWNKPNSATEATKFIRDPISKDTKFSVTISDGVCKKTYDKEVAINSGKIDGSIEISEEDNENSPLKMNATADGAQFHSCGTEVTILADVVGSDFVWNDGTEGNTVKKKGGKYKLSYKDANGCETGFTVEITANPIVDNTINFDTTLCEGENVTFAAKLTAGDETPDIIWKKDGEEVGTGASLVLKKVTSNESGEFTYEATNRGCKKDGTFGTLEVLPRPTYTIKDVDLVCAGESEEIGLETLSPTTAEVTWAESPTLTSTGNTAVVRPEEDETYSFTISQNGGCKITEKITVKVSQPIDFMINANDTTVCVNNIGSLKFGLKLNSGDVLSYEWKNDKDSVVSTSSVLRFSEKEEGTYNYTVTLASEACPSATDEIVVTVAGLPQIDTVTKIDYHNVEIVPNTSMGESPYEYKIDASEFSTSEAFRINYGVHTAIIKDNNGCTNSYDFITESPEFEIPTVITPNGDGINDGFMSQVISEAYPDARVTIYDRYGKKLAEIKGNESWDGTYLGKRMPTTDYWYEIWIDEIRKKYVGHFTLIND